MSTQPVALLPRELGQTPPSVSLVGMKAHGLCQLLGMKARVPRFGLLTSEALVAHLSQTEVQSVLLGARAAFAEGLGTNDSVSKAVLAVALPTPVRLALEEMRASFADDDLLAVRASVIGDPAQSAALAGALDSALGVRPMSTTAIPPGARGSLEDAVLRMFALAFHPRTLQARHKAGLAPYDTLLSVVIQRQVASETSGVCTSLAQDDDEPVRPRAVVSACFGLAGGIGGAPGTSRIARDTFSVERPTLAEAGLPDAAAIHARVAHKTDALRLDDSGKGGTRMIPLLERERGEASLSDAQVLLVTREALRIEAVLGKPQSISFAFAGRLLHLLDIAPVVLPRARIESDRQRTWDERLVPMGLTRTQVSTLTFSVWQRAAARAIERAGRILGVRGVVLEETRPQMHRALGLVSGRVYGNVEVLTALLDLLPFSDKARVALARVTGQPELVPRKAPPPGFWQRTRARFDESRWPAQLERLSLLAASDTEALRDEAMATMRRAKEADPTSLDPDQLLDLFDELEEAHSKVLAAQMLSGLLAALFLVEVDQFLEEWDLSRPGRRNDLLGGAVPSELIENVRRLHLLLSVVDQDPALQALVRDGSLEQLIDDVMGAGPGGESRYAALQTAVRQAALGFTDGSLSLDEARVSERPERLLPLLHAAARLPRPDVERLQFIAQGTRKKAEYAAEKHFDELPGLKGASARKRCQFVVEGLRRHGDDSSTLWLAIDEVTAALRRVALGLGERLFEHQLIDHPRDILQLLPTEIATLVRGTGPDLDVRPIVMARKKSQVTRPPSMPRRVETRGVVATSLLVDEQPVITSPGDVPELHGMAASTGDVHDGVVRLDDPHARLGIAVVAWARVADLPLLLAMRGVVCERGSPLSPAIWALRGHGVPSVIEAPAAMAVFQPGEPVVVSGAQGVVKRMERLPEEHRPHLREVDAHEFLREAIAVDVPLREHASHPAGLSSLPVPPQTGFHSAPTPMLGVPQPDLGTKAGDALTDQGMDVRPGGSDALSEPANTEVLPERPEAPKAPPPRTKRGGRPPRAPKAAASAKKAAPPPLPTMSDEGSPVPDDAVDDFVDDDDIVEEKKREPHR